MHRDVNPKRANYWSLSGATKRDFHPKFFPFLVKETISVNSRRFNSGHFIAHIVLTWSSIHYQHLGDITNLIIDRGSFTGLLIPLFLIEAIVLESY